MVAHSGMRIRSEEPTDIAKVRAVNLAAFDTPAEADLVDALRIQATPVISLVAVVDDAIVGHILFSPVTLEGQSAPLSWAWPRWPSFQRANALASAQR